MADGSVLHLNQSVQYSLLKGPSHVHFGVGYDAGFMVVDHVLHGQVLREGVKDTPGEEIGRSSSAEAPIPRGLALFVFVEDT